MDMDKKVGRIKKMMLLGTVCIPCIWVPSAANAQKTPTGSPVEAEFAGEYIVVTAQKRSERIADVPMSIVAATGERLTQIGVSTTEDLTKLVPGFTYQISDYGTPIYTIRGVGFFDFAIAAVPAVTAYVDQIPLPYSVMTRGATLDLERVEVLKGPQGTLFGQNATGGAINYIPAKPSNTFKAGVSLSYGRFNAVDGEGYVSGPILPTLNARLSVRHESADGWQRSLSRPGDRLGRKSFNNARLLLDWAPADSLRFTLNLSGWSDKSENPAQQFRFFLAKTPPTPVTQFVYNALGNYRFIGSDNRDVDWDPGRNYASNNQFRHVSLHGDWDINDNITLTSLTAYSRFSELRPSDLDGTNFTNLYSTSTDLLKSFTQELRLAGNMAAIKWMLGFNYQSDSTYQFEYFLNFGTNAALGPWYPTTGGALATQNIKTKSGFASLDYALTDTLTAQVSARYTAQDRSFSGCNRDGGDGQVAGLFNLVGSFVGGPQNAVAGGCTTLDDVAGTFASGAVNATLNQHNFAWRGSLNWKPDRDKLIYANLTKGYKFGGFPLPISVFRSQFAPATQESILAYEAGFKLALSDRRVQINGAGFYYDYNDKQIVGTVLNPIFGPLSQLVNIPKSRVIGGEFEVVLQPVSGLRIGNSITFVDSKIQANPRAPGVPYDPFGNVVDFRGERFPNTPKWQTVSDLEYTAPVNDAFNWFAGATFVYRSRASAQLGRNALYNIDGYGLLDLRAGIESANGNWRVQAWGRNVTDKYYWVNVGKIIDTVTRNTGNPATYGITVSFKY